MYNLESYPPKLKNQLEQAYLKCLEKTKSAETLVLHLVLVSISNLQNFDTMKIILLMTQCE